MRGRSSRALTRRLGVNAENAPIHAGTFSRKPKQSFDMNSAARAVFFLVISVIALNGALAANDPGHDSLYVLKIGDSNVAGSINISANLTASFVQFTSKAFGSKLDLVGNDTNLGVNPPVPRIMGLTTGLYLDSNTNLYINRYGGTGSVVQVGDPGGSNGLLLNVSGTIYQQNVKVCLANGTNCLSGNNTGNITSISAGNGITVTNQYGPTVTIATNAPTCTGGQYSYWDGSAWQCGIIAGSSSAGGWTNDSTTTSTALNVNVTNGNLTVSSGYLSIGATPIASSPLYVYDYAAGKHIATFSQYGVYGTQAPASFDLRTENPGVGQPTYSFYGDADTGMYRLTEGTVSFSANSTNIMTYNANGLGVGTIAPNYRLDVNNSGEVIARFANANTPGTSGELTSMFIGLGQGTAYSTGFGVLGGLNASGNKFSMLEFVHSNAGNANTIYAKGTLVLPNNNALAVTSSDVGATANSLYMDTSDTLNVGPRYARMYGLNFWIGNSSANYTWNIHDGSAELMRLTGGGSVGIGTRSPSQKLDVNGSINVSGAGGTIYVGNTQVCLANGTNCLAGGGGSGGGWLNTTTQVYLANNATNVTVDGGVLFVDTASNRVGINTATPKVELDVVGQVNITSGNVTVQQNNGVCFNANCSARMYFNGTAVVIQG